MSAKLTQTRVTYTTSMGDDKKIHIKILSHVKFQLFVLKQLKITWNFLNIVEH
jgi:hypothetical protein